MGWQALEQWGDDVALIERLAGGVANQVWSVRVNGQLAVARLGSRSDADLAWETDLLIHLDRAGLTVPVPIPTMNGRLFADGLVVMTFVEGGPPETEADWRRVADTLRQLHRVDAGLAAATRLAFVDRPARRGDRDEGRSDRDADRGRGPMPSRVGSASAGVRRASSTETPTRATSA